MLDCGTLIWLCGPSRTNAVKPLASPVLIRSGVDEGKRKREKEKIFRRVISYYVCLFLFLVVILSYLYHLCLLCNRLHLRSSIHLRPILVFGG
jgi:hypothetical protein